MDTQGDLVPTKSTSAPNNTPVDSYTTSPQPEMKSSSVIDIAMEDDDEDDDEDEEEEEANEEEDAQSNDTTPVESRDQDSTAANSDSAASPSDTADPAPVHSADHEGVSSVSHTEEEQIGAENAVADPADGTLPNAEGVQVPSNEIPPTGKAADDVPLSNHVEEDKSDGNGNEARENVDTPQVNGGEATEAPVNTEDGSTTDTANTDGMKETNGGVAGDANSNTVKLEVGDEGYVPPPPPKYINSKLDGLRSRLLLDPKENKQTPRHDEDVAQVLSNMRSSPFSPSSNRLTPTSASSSSSSDKHHYHFTSTLSSSSILGRPLLFRSENSSPDFGSPIGTENHIDTSDEKSPNMISETKSEISQNETSSLDDGESSKEAETTVSKPSTDNITTAESASETSTGNTVAENGKDEVVKSETDEIEDKEKAEKLTRFRSKIKEAERILREQKTRNITWIKSGKRINRESSTHDSSNSSIPKRLKTEPSTTIDKQRKIKLNKAPGADNKPPISAASKVKKEGERKRKPATRSRTGCWICRLRKKKCSEEKPACFNCQRLNLDCYYDAFKPDFVADPVVRKQKMDEIRMKTKEAKRQAMKKKNARPAP
ncbi:Zn(2)-C6 fungal-type DNA-binding domain profile [Nakaseomyces glabratus]